jgi:hypothetical protein
MTERGGEWEGDRGGERGWRVKGERGREEGAILNQDGSKDKSYEHSNVT